MFVFDNHLVFLQINMLMNDVTTKQYRIVYIMNLQGYIYHVSYLTRY